ncbi:hypothetical protein CONPUDRAFT_158103 [Coniophora puteana RWD-64-598 SS2]|uniref:C2H2-type domain-containing protein n=1 Tax=Coniophora puteana (strain RWD-64-598) TaxID=741705 RepID=A0A5M3MCI0_CONPW|nr:uncharacterized protein CONPUDRAFT_158103 [Coniophora puteana RWD-64-598 SS2]EIW76962.1 hypothetical protein CONPUDRAFT_158103 [Coniophora puteana RWD-64-598 SS2]
MLQRPEQSQRQYPCPAPGCRRLLSNPSGLTQHLHSKHRTLPPRPSPPPPPPRLRPSDPPFDADGDHFADNNPFQADTGHERDASDDSGGSSLGKIRLLRGGGVRVHHRYLDGRPCDGDGNFLGSADTPPGPPPPPPPQSRNDWSPFQDRVAFETADFLYTRSQAPVDHINFLMRMWGLSLEKYGADPPFADHTKLHKTIDAIKTGDVPWSSFTVSYKGAKPTRNAPAWMDESYDVWYRDPHAVVQNMLANPDFKDVLDYSPYRDYDAADVRQWENMFSGDWAWDQANEIASDPSTHGATFVPVILGSDKTTVSVATGQTDYYPLYLSIGNVHNTVRRAHRNAVTLIGFLAIPKTDKSHSGDPAYRHFRRQLFHSTLAKILSSLKPGMTNYEVLPFSDGYHRRVIFGLGPYIADYPEQALLSCIVQGWCPKCIAYRDELDTDATLRCKEHNDLLLEELDWGTLWDSYGVIGNAVPFTNDLPRADIHELITPDILHQLIKGTFKDHLVDWTVAYLFKVHAKPDALAKLDDIDRRIAAVAPFSGLRRFPNGRGFKQWTGDDSKALMKVYLPAIEGHVPPDVVRTFRAFLEFCYLVRRDIHSEETIREVEGALKRFHQYRGIFKTVGVASTLSLPRQHSLTHYALMIRLFGAPNGLCSSITESKHIKAVKEPWRRSNHFNALFQMLLINQRLDKLAACRVDFEARGMLTDVLTSSQLETLANYSSLFGTSQDSNGTALCWRGQESQRVDEDPGDPVDGRIDAKVMLAATKARGRAKTIPALADELELPVDDLLRAVRLFLYDQYRPASDSNASADISPADYPAFNPSSTIHMFNSAVTVFRAPSDFSGTTGMRRELIRSTLLWRTEAPRHDCAFVSTNPDVSGMLGMEVARIFGFLSFDYQSRTFSCALVQWYSRLSDNRDEDTGMYMVRPDVHDDGLRSLAFVPVGSLVRSAHLIPYYGDKPIPRNLKHYQSYDNFSVFYVNRYADHHSFEIA